MTDALSMDPTVMEAQAATVTARRAPERPYVSDKLGASDVAPMMVAWLAAGKPVEALAGLPALEWATKCARRAALPKSKLPPELKSPQLSAVWGADRGRIISQRAVLKGGDWVVEDITPGPEMLLVKAGIVERERQDKPRSDGDKIEPVLWREWRTRYRHTMKWARYAFDGVPEEWRELGYDGRPRYSAHKVSHKTAPLVTYPDVWGADLWADRFVGNLKGTMHPKDALDPPYMAQAQAEMAATDAPQAIYPHGIGWLADWMREPVEERPIKVFTVQRDEAAVQAIEAFATRAVEWIRETAKAAVTL